MMIFVDKLVKYLSGEKNYIVVKFVDNQSAGFTSYTYLNIWFNLMEFQLICWPLFIIKFE